MTKAAVTSVDRYMAAQPKSTRDVLERVRRTIRQALPGCEEVISYKIPAYKLAGRTVIYFAGWKRHYSLYPISAQTIEAIDSGAATYVIEKSTIRFPLSAPVPVKLIGEIATRRAKEIHRAPLSASRRGSSASSR